MVRNIPYFRCLDDLLADEIVQCLKPKRYEIGTDIVKRGDNVDQITLLKAGQIDVLLPPKPLNTTNLASESAKTSNNEQWIYLDSLNEGSCFCIYSAFSEEMT